MARAAEAGSAPAPLFEYGGKKREKKEKKKRRKKKEKREKRREKLVTKENGLFSAKLKIIWIGWCIIKSSW